MKILIYAHLFPPSKGGIQYSNLEIAKGLYSLKHCIRVIACQNRGIRKFVKDVPFPVTILPKWPFTPMSSLSERGYLNWLFSPIYFFIILREIYRMKPDMILVTDETANCYWGVIAKFVNLPYISYCSVPVFTSMVESYSRRGVRKLRVLIQNQFMTWLSRSYKGATKILAVSRSTMNELRCYLPELADKIHIVPRSVDDAFFDTPFDNKGVSQIRQKYHIHKDEVVLLSVSRISGDKGIDDVLKALSGFDPAVLSRIKYVIVGEGEKERYLRRLAVELKLEDNVLFTGGIEHSQIIPYYDMCDVFLLPSRRDLYESFGRVFVEASARCKASIGSHGGGMVDIIQDWENGFLVGPGDVAGIRNRIEYVVSHRQTVKEMGSRARLEAEKRYTSKTIALKFEDHLRTVLNQTSKHYLI